MLAVSLAAAVLAIAAPAAAQSADISESVGPLTTVEDKKAVKSCDITAYGAKADGETDISTAITDAFADCKAGGVVVIPAGDYALESWVTLSGGQAWALQLDGTIYRTGTTGGNMIFIEHTTDFEFYSSTGAGAIQGYGYEIRKDGGDAARLLRFYEVTSFSIHDVILVDSPAFHFSIDTCDKGEVYNMLIRGGNQGGLDGIDVWSTNIWIHDVMVTNKDECVTVKSPASNILIENIYCNWSGGCAMGSLGEGVDVSNITYRNVYTWNSNQMYMIKSYGGSGTVKDVLLENFIGHGNAYSLDIDQYWASMEEVSGEGVQLSSIAISNWTGTCVNGAARGPVKILCADGAPCTGVDITDFAVWTEAGDELANKCQSAYTDTDPAPFCLKEGSGSSYEVTEETISSAPSGSDAPKMSDDLEEAFGTTVEIPIPTFPASFFPGIAPVHALAASA
ncbi:glycoside hydrolase family 28 protein [Dothistroma septosporum NZE10]|uniref:Glycoside hydrolase family 28 protein n=1 Tax=Dothistroma septosporum (strain NZE10 / CBS 128990) TaxID=675120 RepID=M2YMA1_DOTSN|nr:glycoside hydrolase family 28 protein [Dothistroma septosporum NZE10]